MSVIKDRIFLAQISIVFEDKAHLCYLSLGVKDKKASV